MLLKTLKFVGFIWLGLLVPATVALGALYLFELSADAIRLLLARRRPDESNAATSERRIGG